MPTAGRGAPFRCGALYQCKNHGPVAPSDDASAIAGRFSGAPNPSQPLSRAADSADSATSSDLSAIQTRNLASSFLVDAILEQWEHDIRPFSVQDVDAEDAEMGASRPVKSLSFESTLGLWGERFLSSCQAVQLVSTWGSDVCESAIVCFSVLLPTHSSNMHKLFGSREPTGVFWQ